MTFLSVRSNSKMSSEVDLEDMRLLGLRSVRSRPEDAAEEALDWPYLLLIHCIVDFLWGIALIVFSTGAVPVTWVLSQWGRQHTAVVNILVTLVATISTTHAKNTVASIIEVYTAAKVSSGFTLAELQFLQSMYQWDPLPPFADGKFARLFTPRTWMWLLFYGGIALHSASIVAILQPVSYNQYVIYNDTIPCPVDLDSLTLDPSPHIGAETQSDMDEASYGVGLQLGNYYGETPGTTYFLDLVPFLTIDIDQVGGNTTSAFLGRAYVKQNVSYGVVGGLQNGLQEIPGVTFQVSCDTLAPDSLESLWSDVFPDGPSIPAVSITKHGRGSFIYDDISVNSSLIQSVTSSDTFNLTDFNYTKHTAIHGAVNASGSGGIVSVTKSGELVGCTWQTHPVLVQVQIIDFIGYALNTVPATLFPEPMGRAVLSTLQGMAQAVLLGAPFDDEGEWRPYYVEPTGLSDMLSKLLSDGTKASLTSFNSGSGYDDCYSNNRTISPHWRFGNDHQLGWIACVLTVGTAIYGFVLAYRLRRRKRARSVKPLHVSDAFMLGVNNAIGGGLSRSTTLQLRGGVAVSAARQYHGYA